jgi:branched-chain amino acid transport system permease protein
MKPLLTVQSGSVGHRVYQLCGWAPFLALVAVLPYMLKEFQVGRLNRAILVAVAVLGVNLVIGYGGLLALGHSAFMGIGAFVAATLISDEGWDFWLVFPVVFVVGFILGMILGLPALRIRGLYLALVTIAFAAVFPQLTKIDGLSVGGKTIIDRTGGANGRRIEEIVEAPDFLPDSIFGGPLEGYIYRYWVIVALAAFCFWGVRNLLRSRPGRAIVAIRDNEIGAAVSGVNLPLYKTLTFGLSSALAAVGGVMLAFDKGFVAEQDFTFDLAVQLLVALVVGGLATLWGPIVGALVVVFVREATKDWPDKYLGFLDLPNPEPLSLAFFGAILILVTFFAPGGIVGAVRKLRMRFVRVEPPPPPVGVKVVEPSPEEAAALAEAERVAAEAPTGLTEVGRESTQIH